MIHSTSAPSSHEPALSVAEIKKELTENGVSFADCFDKESLLLRLTESRVKAANDTSNPPTRPTDGDDENENAPTTTTELDGASILEEIRAMTVRELREELSRRNRRWAGLLEKEDLVQDVYNARMSAIHFSATGLIAPGEVGELTGEELVEELTKTDSPLLLDAYATWCGPCQMMAPQLVEAAKDFGDRVRVVKMDTDKHPEQASALKVQGLPTLILFINGKEHDRIEGALMKNQLMQWVESKF